MNKIGVGILGVAGRMGQMVALAVDHEQAYCKLVAGCEHSGAACIGQSIGSMVGRPALNDVSVIDDMAELCQKSDIIIDFSLPKATLALVPLAVKHKTPLVIGATGFDAAGKAALKDAAKTIPIVFAPNFSVGVNLIFKLAAEAAKILGDDFDVEIFEAHHRNKVDAPSGTAMRLGEVIAEALDRSLDQCAIYGREGEMGVRPKETIAFSTMRAGNIVGDHTAFFVGESEQVEITHRAASRMTFAKGSVRAARWLMKHPPGLYDMGDVLGLH
ncbi:4-hydroxy-tetrahydrodipicolinate reductase [Magnetococcales bacterium HHB-1]